MGEMSNNPEELLHSIQKKDRKKGTGHLKIFFGYAAGVGKTYAMLKAAHTAKRRGTDVLAGYVETHDRPQIAQLLKGLELQPVKKVASAQGEKSEFDLDAAMARKPSLILIDELAHTNAPGCRHSKRYQDVEELLKAGIDVYTTLNVQHLESLCDMVASITGVMIRERIPDRVFNDADQVELVDMEPQELIERLEAGYIYKESQARKALANFFSEGNLTALREIALRRCADRVYRLSEIARAKSSSDYYTDEHILVCLSTSPSNGKIIRTAARMANAFRGNITAVFVETPAFSAMSQENQNRLRDNIQLAKQLGASIETVYGDDIAYQIAEFARFSGVSKIVVGRNHARRKHFLSKPVLTERLITYAPNLDIHIIPDKDGIVYKAQRSKIEREKFHPADLFQSCLVLVGATVVGGIFYKLGFSESNIIMVYILAVLVTSILTTQRIYSMISSLISVLVFNFFFTEPRFTLNAYDTGYPATFLIMFTAAFLTGTLADKIKQHARQSARTAFRTKILFDTNQLLQKAREKNDIISVTASQLMKLLNRDIVFYEAQGGELQKPCVFSLEGEDTQKEYLSVNEWAVAAWAYKNNKHAGASTNTLANAKCLYLAVRAGDHVFGVIGIVLGEVALDAFENSILLSILGECALALENELAAREKEEAAILAKNEQLRANLLRAISHDLRTPLTSISGSAAVLLASHDDLDIPKRTQLYQDIYEDSLWLINLVENLLSVTRIEDGTMNLKLSAELMEEVIAEALQHVNRKSVEHSIVVNFSDEFMMAKVDVRLIVQVIINILDNAIKYTPRDSAITVSVSKQNGNILVEIADNGPGIPDEAKPRIFDMFYTWGTKVADSRRSLGLGLALCKAIIHAHGGEITVTDNLPTGTVFSFTLKEEEVNLHE